MLHPLATDGTITNVYLFVCDSLRLDALPERVKERGLTVPTITHGLCTPPSLASLVTGRYPPQHGVEWFGHTLAEPIPSLFDIKGIETGFTSMWDDTALDAVVGNPSARTLDDVTEPFFLLEHDHGGHVNYPGYRELPPKQMLRDHIDVGTVEQHYRSGISESAERFSKRLHQLDEAELLDETLVIFTSDHGELLDERGGFVGHQLPACPELFEVPTVFIHPELPTGTVAEGYIRHVDVEPTVHQLLTDERRSADGVSLVKRPDTTPPSYTHVAVRAPAAWRDSTVLTHFDPLYAGNVVWQGEGGYFCNDSGRLRSALTAYFEAAESTGSLSAHYAPERPLFDRFQAFHRELKGDTVFRDPAMSRTRAVEITAMAHQDKPAHTLQALSESTRTALRDLGYRP